MYWALGIPRLSQEFALAIRQYPALRNIAQRVLEPLAAADHGAVANLVESSKQSSTGAAIHIDKVSVSRSRSVLLDDVDCEIAPGDHIAIVGASGAGKTSLVALLLGLLAPDSGRVSMDVEPQAVAWVDPAIQLWNRSLLDNVAYGAAGDEQIPLHTLLEAADLVEVLQGLPNGLQSSLGEGGGFLSGGEGQRVRLARALAKHSARLVLLDEPFRGLDREQRAQLLRRARAGWSRATLLCITHNIAETRDFPRVLVLREGRIVEDGNPAQLAANSGSHYAGLLAAHGALGERWLSDSSWRHGTLQAGQLVESEPRREA
jgi:ATP-binding cassette subfamily B protein